MTPCGIYKIQSIIHPDHFYIGSAIYFRNRWCTHLRDLRLQKHCNIKLQRHYNKYGKADLVFIILEPCFPEFLIIREQYYIDTLNPSFNILRTAGSMYGHKFSDETKIKIGLSSKNRVCSDETRKKMSIARTGRIYSEKTRNKISLLKQNQSKETRKKNSESCKKAWELRRLNGRDNRSPKKESTKIKISESNKETWILRRVKMKAAQGNYE